MTGGGGWGLGVGGRGLEYGIVFCYQGTNKDCAHRTS